MLTLVIPIQPELPDLLSASSDDTTWVVTITLLTAAIATPISGRLGDMYGKRRIIVVLLIILIVGSIIAAVSTTLIPLMIGRALQGTATGCIPLGISILRDVLHRDQLGSAVALVSATLGMGGAVGLPVSALISYGLGWHALFWVSAALAGLVLVLVATIVPPSTLVTREPFDFVGAVGLAISLSAVLLSISKGSAWGWSSVPTIVAAAGGVLVLLAWGWYELRRSSPLVDLRVAARPAVLLTNLASIAVGFSLFASSVALPQLLELPIETGHGLGQSRLIAGLVLAPSGLVMMLVSPLSARLSARFGARFVLAGGAAAVGASYLTALFAMTDVWHILIVSALNGVGVGLAYAAMPTLIMRSVPAAETAAGNGLNALMRSLGTTAAAAGIGAVLTSFTIETVSGPVPSVDGFRIAFLLGAAAAAIAVALALCIPRVPAAYDGHPSLPTDDHPPG